SDAIEMTDFAKRIGISPPKFTELLRNVGILRKDRRRDGKFRNLPTEAWKSAFDVRPRQLDNGRWLDLALLNPQRQVDVLEELHRRGRLDSLAEDWYLEPRVGGREVKLTTLHPAGMVLHIVGHGPRLRSGPSS